MSHTTTRSIHWPYWSDSTWRTYRIIQLCTALSTIVILVAYLAGASALLYPLAAVVILNVVAATFLLARTLWMRFYLHQPFDKRS